ncbi:MAG: methylated-DNA--[protein]-cysteine S-methyltransferase [bacterium]
MNKNPKAMITTIESLLGPVSAGHGGGKVLCLSIGNQSEEHVRETLREIGYEPVAGQNRLGEKIARELSEYLKGARSHYTVEPYFSGTAFQVKVWETLCRIPYGQVITYGELAVQAGYPRAARAVGMAMARNRIPIIVPCHRVIATNGQLGGFGCGVEVKRALLWLEGATGVAL